MSFFISHLLFSEKPLRSMLYRNASIILVKFETKLHVQHDYSCYNIIYNFN